MLALFLQLFVFRSFVGEPAPTRKRTLAAARAGKSPGDPMVKWLIIGWAAIIAKCAGLWWVIGKYQVPIHPMWLVGPTVLFGLLATAAYIWRK